MAIVGDDGFSYSLESDDLIAELKKDIAEFGPNNEFYAWYKVVDGIKLYTNYDFAEPEKPIDFSKEVKDDEQIEVLKGSDLLERLEKQNAL